MPAWGRGDDLAERGGVERETASHNARMVFLAKLELVADDDIEPNRRLAEAIERTEATHSSNNMLLLLIN